MARNYPRKGKGKVASAPAAGMPQCPPAAGSHPSPAFVHPKAQGQWVHAVLWLPFTPGAQPTGPPPPWLFAPPPPAPPRAREESSESSEDRLHKLLSNSNSEHHLTDRPCVQDSEDDKKGADKKRPETPPKAGRLSFFYHKTCINQHSYFAFVLSAILR